MFAREGFAGASIAAIAQASGVARPLVLYHFESKEALWRLAVAEAFEALRADMHAAQHELSALPSPTLVDRFARRLVEFGARHPALVRIVVDETGKPGERAEWLLATYLVPMYEMARRLIGMANALPGSGLRPVAPEHFVPAVLGLMNFIFLDAEVIARAYGIDVHDPAVVARHGEFVAALLLDGLRAR